MMAAVFLAALACCGLAFAQENPVNKARELLDSGARDQAISLLYKVTKTAPGNTEARVLLGSALAEKGERAESICQLREAVRLSPRSVEAQLALGEAFDTFHEPAAAREQFERAVQVDPKSGQAHADLGAVLLETGQIDAATEHLDRALKILGHTPEAGYALYLRAKICDRRGETSKCAAALSEAVRLRPDLAEAWSDLGTTRKALLDDAGALKAYMRAVELSPNDAVAQYRLGAEYLHQNQSRLAVEHLEMAYQLNPDDQSTLNALQNALREEGRMAEANQIKQKLVDLLRKRDRANQDAVAAIKINNDGAALEKSGDLPGALEKYRQALQLYPDHVGIRVNYAIALLRLGHWTEGLNELHECLQRDPGNAEIQAALKDALSQAPPEMVPKWSDEK